MKLYFAVRLKVLSCPGPGQSPDTSIGEMKFIQEVNVEVCWFSVEIFNFCLAGLLQELFAELDTEEDGNVYLKEVIVTLKALNHDLDHNLRVGILV